MDEGTSGLGTWAAGMIGWGRLNLPKQPGVAPTTLCPQSPPASHSVSDSSPVPSWPQLGLVLGLCCPPSRCSGAREAGATLLGHLTLRGQGGWGHAAGPPNDPGLGGGGIVLPGFRHSGAGGGELGSCCWAFWCAGGGAGAALLGLPALWGWCGVGRLPRCLASQCSGAEGWQLGVLAWGRGQRPLWGVSRLWRVWKVQGFR